MNKRKQFILVVLFILGFLFLLKYSETQSVLSVLNQRSEAYRNAKQRIHKNGEVTESRVINMRRYVEGLYKIDTSHCPKKFQLAWLDYVQTCERLEKIPGRMLVDFFVGTATGSIFPLVNEIPKTEKTGDELLLAEQNLELVALEYDVRVIHR